MISLPRFLRGSKPLHPWPFSPLTRWVHPAVDAAAEALTDMPPRSETELDPITLHNQALMNMEEDAEGGFEKLQFLLQQNPCPPGRTPASRKPPPSAARAHRWDFPHSSGVAETFGNLLLLYCKFEHYDLAADVLAENTHLTYQHLSPVRALCCPAAEKRQGPRPTATAVPPFPLRQYLYEFLDATITRQTSPEEAFRRLDEMCTRSTEQLRKLTRQVQASLVVSGGNAPCRLALSRRPSLPLFVPARMEPGVPQRPGRRGRQEGRQPVRRMPGKVRVDVCCVALAIVCPPSSDVGGFGDTGAPFPGPDTFPASWRKPRSTGTFKTTAKWKRLPRPPPNLRSAAWW